MAEVSALRDLEELRGYTQSNPLSVSPQEATDVLSQREESARVAGTVSPFQSSWKPWNPNFRATAQNAISNMLGGSNISSSDNYLGGRVANTLTGLLDFAPVVGDAVGVGDTMTSYRQGDMLGTGINALATGVGVLPLVGGPASKAVKAGGNRVRSALRGIDAWHGSPHRFNNFSMSNIGTGEGAQAYGHGLYFAENKGVSENYAKVLGDDMTAYQGAMNDVNRAVSPYTDFQNSEYMVNWAYEGGYDPKKESLYDFMVKEIDEGGYTLEEPDGVDIQGILKAAQDPEVIKATDRMVMPVEPTLYNVNLNVEPDELLDWDAPLSQQPKKVQDMWQKFAKSRKGKASAKESGIEDIRNLVPRYGNEITGEDIHKAIYSGQPVNFNHDYSSNIAPQENKMTSEYLQRQGIKGIRYLDGASRSLPDFYISSPDTTVSGKWMVKDIGNPNSQGSHFDTEMAAKSYLDEIQSKPTRNYVMFDDSLVDTKRVNDKLTDSWMNPEARMARADKGGFDTGRVAYRGLSGEYDPSKAGNYQMFTSSPEDAGEYGSSVVPAYLRKGNNLVVEGGRSNFNSIPVRNLPDEVRANLHSSVGSVARTDDIAYAAQAAGYDSVSINNVFDKASNEIPLKPPSASNAPMSQEMIDLLDEVDASGMLNNTPDVALPPEIPRNYDPTTIDIIFDPKNIRSINAEFDPTKADSSDLLSSISPTQSSLRNIA